MCHVYCSLECVTSIVPLNVSRLSFPWMCHIFRYLECVTSLAPLNVSRLSSPLNVSCLSFQLNVSQTDRQTDTRTKKYRETYANSHADTHMYTHTYTHIHTCTHARTLTNAHSPLPTPPTQRVWNREPSHTPCNKEVVTHQDNKQKTSSQWKFWGGNRPEKRP